MLWLLTLLHLAQLGAYAVDEGACIIVKRFEPSEDFTHTRDCEDGDDGVGCMHDFVVEVWLNEGDKATSKQTTKVAHNMDSPVWNEKLCWQSTMSSVNFALYEDDTYSSQDTEFFVEGITPKEGISTKVKRRSRNDLRIGLKNSSNQLIGVLYYGTDVDDSLWGFTAEQQTCLVDNMVVEITEPTWYTPLKGGWINGPKKPFAENGESLLIKRYAATLRTQICPAPVDGKISSPFTGGQFYNAVALIPWVFHDMTYGEEGADSEDCTAFDVVQWAEDAGAKGVIFHLSGAYTYQPTFVAYYMANHPQAPTATIPARWIEYVEYQDIARAYDVHDVEKQYVRLTCPWQFEEDFMEEMCITDTFFSGEYEVLKTKDSDGYDVTVTVNDHAVWRSKATSGLPVYVVNTKNIGMDQLGLYRWVVTTSLSAEFLLAVCQTTTRVGESMEPNDCENWRIYDKQYNQWQDHLLSIINFCPRENKGKDYSGVMCSHTAANFVIDSAGPMTETLARSYPTVVGLIGPSRYETDTVEIVLLDGSNFEGCEPYDGNTKDIYGSTADVKGKIVIVSRGTCYFQVKQLMAEDAGAVGLIVVNYDGETAVYMSPSGTDAVGSIPMRMISFDEMKPIREGMDQLGPIHPFKGGFYCASEVAEPAAELCVGLNNVFSDDYGFHNDFHGTFVRLREDYQGHAAYRLDPLSNTDLSGKIYGTKTSGIVKQGIDHTKTYLYYDAGGVGDTGNAWKIGPELGGGEEHIFAYCRGPLYEDMTDPVNCEASGGSWLTWLPNYSPPDFYDLNNHRDESRDTTVLFNGQCSWDMATGDGWTDLDDFDGIFCKKHKNCLPNEYCMDCGACLDKNSSSAIFKGDMFTHPCSYCFYERDTESSKDDAICTPLVSCSTDVDASKKGEDFEGASFQCIDACQANGLSAEDECPKFPGCDEEACGDTDKLWANGVCNSECAACPEWQVEPFDGTDCDDRENQFEVGQKFAGNKDLLCSFVDNGYLAVKYSIPMKTTITVTDVKGSRVTLEFAYEQVEGVDADYQDIARTLTINAVETSAVKWEGSPSVIDDASVMRFDKLIGTLGKSEDQKSKDNPEGMFITVRAYSDADLPEGSHMDCDELMMPMGKPSKDKPSKEPTNPPDGLKGMALCAAFDKKNCKANDAAKRGECVWDGSAQKGKGYCMWNPSEEAPTQEQCLEDGGGFLYIKGKGDATNWKKQDARNATPCGCLLKCQTDYVKKGPYVAFTLETGTKKGKDYAKCTCWRTLKKVNKAAGGEFQTGSVIPGYIAAWMKK